MTPKRGFTLIEMIIVFAIIVALAGILVPIVSDEVEGSKRSKAQATVNRIATAVSQYTRDTGGAPTGRNGKKVYHYLRSAGENPSANPFDSGRSAELADFLCANKANTTAWEGPYLAEPGPDPWGIQYLVNAHGYFNGTERVWVISAGPDRTLQTKPTDTGTAGDDIGVFVQ